MPHVLLQDSPANPFVNQRSSLRALAFCLLLVTICYSNSITNAFILDDILIVAANERIRSVSPIEFLFQPYWSSLEPAGIYRPFTIFSFSLEYSVWQAWAPGFRLTNLLLHALNGWLVFLLTRGLFASPLAAWASAAVYVVHPIQTEAVISIVGRSELLAAAFFFSAWLAFRRGLTSVAAAAYLFAALAKESAITFPAIAALDMAVGSGSVRTVFQSWRRFAVLAAVGICYLGLRFYVLGGFGVPSRVQYMGGIMTLEQRWMTSGRVFLEYFRMLLAPVQVTGDWDFNSIPVATVRDWDAWLGLALVAGCIFAAVWNLRKRQWLALGILFFFVTLLPVSNWIMPIALLIAERFLYTPLFAFALLAGICWSAIPRVEIRRLVAVGVLAISAILCIGHNYIWQDTLSFHSNVVRQLPNNARGRLGYGYALLRINRVEEAKVQFEEGLRIMPDSAPLVAGLASTTLRIEGHCGRVRPLLARAFEIQPGQWQSLWILGDCLLMEGRPDLAEKSYRMAVENAPFPDARLLFAWGRLLEELGDSATAMAAYERAAIVDPSFFKSDRPTESFRSDRPADTNATPDPAPSSGQYSDR